MVNIFSKVFTAWQEVIVHYILDFICLYHVKSHDALVINLLLRTRLLRYASKNNVV